MIFCVLLGNYSLPEIITYGYGLSHISPMRVEYGMLLPSTLIFSIFL